MNLVSMADLADLAGDLVVSAGAGGPLAPGGPFLVELDDVDVARAGEVAHRLAERPAPIVIGRSRRRVPAELGPLLAQLTFTLAPGGPGRSWVEGGDEDLTAIDDTVAAAPVAATALAGLLAQGDDRSVHAAITVESAVYSMLLSSDEFHSWRARTPTPCGPVREAQVRIERDRDVVRIELNRPDRRNAFGHAMRDQLLEALAVAETDSTVTRVVLSGAGPAFCSGGDLAEFGSAGSPALAHLLRLQTSVGMVVHRLRRRVQPVLHGACIGAGIEIPSFADHLVAREGAWFQLPEVGMGLIPGAGGTVSLPRRIGRWRTAYMALSRRRIPLDLALDWGLVDARA